MGPTMITFGRGFALDPGLGQPEGLSVMRPFLELVERGLGQARSPVAVAVLAKHDPVEVFLLPLQLSPLLFLFPT